MKAIVTDYLAGLTLGGPQAFCNLAVIPLLAAD